MARIELNGFDDLCEAFNRISDIPDSITEEALEGMAKVAEEKIREQGESMGVRDPESDVHILDNLKRKKPEITPEGGYAVITFTGKRPRGQKGTRNAEIAFVNEYGSRKMKARPFVGTAMSKNERQITQPGIDTVGNWIESEFKK